MQLLDILSWVVAIPLLGVATGLRTMVPIAVLCWFAYLGHLPVHYSWAFWTTKLAAAVIFTLLGLGEFVVDKLPKTPARVSPGPLLARLVLGGLVGAIAAAGLKGSGMEGTMLGVLGALVGAFGGYLIRRELVEKLMCQDWYIAVAEDIFAIGCAVIAMGLITG